MRVISLVTAAAMLFSFVSATEAQTVRFAVIGDYGSASTSASNKTNEAAVASLVQSWSPQFVITTGDNNYDTGSAATIDYNIGQYYQQFIGNYQGAYGPGSTDINRFFPSLGNHDYGTANAQPYLNYFTLPGNERYYDFTWGPIHFFAVNSDSHEPNGNTANSTQAQWLQTQLTASTSAWDIVYFHHPPYSSGEHGSSTGMRWAFDDWGADLVLAGHEHNYERLEVDGLTYVVNGLGGKTLRAFPGEPLPQTIYRYTGMYGAQLIEVTATQLHSQFILTNGTVVDDFTLTKLHAGDANGDGVVNLADLQILGDNWQSGAATWAMGDFTGDGIVNLADLQVIGDNWGFGSGSDLAFEDALGSTGGPIPEPGSLAVALLSVCVIPRRGWARA